MYTTPVALDELGEQNSQTKQIVQTGKRNFLIQLSSAIVFLLIREGHVWRQLFAVYNRPIAAAQ